MILFMFKKKYERLFLMLFEMQPSEQVFLTFSDYFNSRGKRRSSTILRPGLAGVVGFGFIALNVDSAWAFNLFKNIILIYMIVGR